MSADIQPTAPVSTKLIWAGRIVSALVVLVLLLSGGMKLTKGEQVVEGFKHLGYPETVILAIGVVEVTCAIVYAIPQTAVIGAILITGYLGGATATHVRLGEPFWGPIVLGMIAWLGLFLRDARIRALIPLRKL